METPDIYPVRKNCCEVRQKYYNHFSSEKDSPWFFECDKCDKHYKLKTSLKRHIESKHRSEDVLKLKLHNENLKLQMKLYCDQIKFLKRLILIQDLTLRAHGMKNIEMNKKSTDNSNNPLTKLEHYNNDNYTAKDIERLHLT